MVVSVSVDRAALLAIANTRHGIEAWRPLPPADRLATNSVVDRLRTARDAVAFLRALEIDVPAAHPTGDQLVRLRDIRECARALAEGDRRGYARRLGRLLAGVDVKVAADGTLRPRGDGWDRFADELAVILVDLGARSRRVKLCHNSACAWLFVDATRNNGQVWCTEQLCADRMRVRRARRRAARE